jgi:ABC-type dipeptide transport system, periplasmic component
MSRRRKLSALASVVAGALALSACAGNTGATPSTEASAETPVTGGTYTHAFSIAGAITSLNPPTLIFHEGLQVVKALTDNLVDQDPDTGEIVPWLATTWTISDDAKTYTFDLRDGVTFSDGAVFDAASVKANFDYIQSRAGSGWRGTPREHSHSDNRRRRGHRAVRVL